VKKEKEEKRKKTSGISDFFGDFLASMTNTRAQANNQIN
jgi:hypothetical protein